MFRLIARGWAQPSDFMAMSFEASLAMGEYLDAVEEAEEDKRDRDRIADAARPR